MYNRDYTIKSNLMGGKDNPFFAAAISFSLLPLNCRNVGSAVMALMLVPEPLLIQNLHIRIFHKYLGPSVRLSTAADPSSSNQQLSETHMSRQKLKKQCQKLLHFFPP
jgi:hypothetical protein